MKKIGLLASAIVTCLVTCYYLGLELTQASWLMQILFLLLSSIGILMTSYKISQIYLQEQENRRKFMKSAVLFITFLYLIQFVNFFFLTLPFDRFDLSLSLDWKAYQTYFATSVNLIPLKGIIVSGGQLANSNLSLKSSILGNFIAFMPIAFCFPVLCKKMNEPKPFCLSVIMLVVELALLQVLFLTGSIDINMIILNILGAMTMFYFLTYPPIRQKIDAILYFPRTSDASIWNKKKVGKR